MGRSAIPFYKSWRWWLGVILLLPFVLYTYAHFQRPSHTAVEVPLFQGITYKRFTRYEPRIHVVHVVQVDLMDPDLKVKVTPGVPGEDHRETVARTTSKFLQDFQLQVAVNAGFFYPFEEKTPWNYFPRNGDRVNVLGQAMAAGVEYSPRQDYWGVLCFAPDGLAQILASGECPDQTQAAVAGRYVLQPSQRRLHLTGDKAYARTLVALDGSGQTLWLIVVDGKQPYYSEGILISEAEMLVQELGAVIALNLDGGGSSTLVMTSAGGPKVLNAPIHTKWPMRERPVATHLGFYAHPLNSPGRGSLR